MPARSLLRHSLARSSYVSALGSRRGSRDALVIYFRQHYRPREMLLPWSGYRDHWNQGNQASNSVPMSTADARRQKQTKASRPRCVLYYGGSLGGSSQAHHRPDQGTASHQQTSGVWNVRLGTWRSVLLCCAEWVSTFVGPPRRLIAALCHPLYPQNH